MRWRRNTRSIAYFFTSFIYPFDITALILCLRSSQHRHTMFRWRYNSMLKKSKKYFKRSEKILIMLKLISIDGLIVITAHRTLNNGDNNWTENVNTMLYALKIVRRFLCKLFRWNSNLLVLIWNFLLWTYSNCIQINK